jgi:hypothetical protein
MTKEVIINSYPRTGNTFMVYALRSAYELNSISWNEYPIIAHTHSRHMQRLENTKNFYQISAIRNPIDTICSYAVHSSFNDNKSLKIDENVANIVNHSLDSYLKFYSEWLMNKNARMINFDTLKDDASKIISVIFKDLDINYSNKINPESVLKTLQKFDMKNNSGIWTGHTPRLVESLDEYQIVKNFIVSTDEYENCLSLYKEILEEIN